MKESKSLKQTALGLYNHAVLLTCSLGNTAGLSELVSSLPRGPDMKSKQVITLIRAFAVLTLHPL